MTSYIARAQTTGTYHLAVSASAAHCNASTGLRRIGRKTSYRRAQAGEIERASEGAFCKKCFPHGKPAITCTPA